MLHMRDSLSTSICTWYARIYYSVLYTPDDEGVHQLACCCRISSCLYIFLNIVQPKKITPYRIMANVPVVQKPKEIKRVLSIQTAKTNILLTR